MMDPAEAIVRAVREREAHIVGIGGSPGAGKSTVARAVRNRLDDALVVSLDDYYLTKADRAARGFRFRGPPGSHDVRALVNLLDDMREGKSPVVVQRFSAEIDDRVDPVVVDRVPGVLIVEGMLLGYRGDGYDEILDRLDLFVFL